MGRGPRAVTDAAAAALDGAMSNLTTASDRLAAGSREGGQPRESGAALGPSAAALAIDTFSEALQVTRAHEANEGRAAALALRVRSEEDNAAWSAAKVWDARALELFIEAGGDADVADVNNAVTNWGWTSAHTTASRGNAAALEVLIMAGYDANAKDSYGSAPAHLAAEKGHAAALDVLVKAGCDVNAADGDECTPAFRAAEHGRTRALAVLIKAGCHLKAKARCGSTAAIAAVRGGHAPALRLLIDAGCDVIGATIERATVAQYAASRGFAAALEVLIRAGCDIHSSGNSYAPRPLAAAIRNDHFECVRALARAGAELIAKEDAADWYSQRTLQSYIESAHHFTGDYRALKHFIRQVDGERREKIYAFLCDVVVAGGWHSYVIEGRRTLVTLMALWKRQRRLTPDPQSPPTRSAASKCPPGGGGSGAPQSSVGAPGDVAVWVQVFELPPELADRVLRFYADLVL